MERTESPPTNLPPPAATFVGREAELQALARDLENPECRLVTVVGPGGIGKTRLAIHAARSYLAESGDKRGSRFADGVYLVSLASVRGSDEEGDPDAGDLSQLLAGAIADALDLSFHAHAEPAMQVVDELREKRALLVFDNFEALLPAANWLVSVLRQAPGVKAIVTSRERLNLSEECLLPLAGLPYPTLQELGLDEASADSWPGAAPSAEKLERYAAVALFVDRARQARPGYSLTSAESYHVVRLCALLGGVPLAIELAAAWLQTLSTAEVVREVARNIDFLAASGAAVAERHRSLRAVFEQTWAGLSSLEQAAFPKLSVFEAGFQREAAETVAGAALLTLTSLVNKSLLRQTAAGRYHLHELLRQYAAEKLWVAEAQAGVAESLWERYCAYYLGLVAQRAAALHGPEPRQALLEIRAELDNVRRAWRWAVNELALDDLAGSAEALATFYDLSGLLLEGHARLQAAAERLQAYLEDGPESPAAIRARELLGHVLTEQARLLVRRGLAEPAVETAREALTMARALRARQLEAAARRQLGEALFVSGQTAEAEAELREALILARIGGWRLIEAEAMRDLAICLHNQSRYADARSLYQEALNLFRQLGERRSRAVIGMNLGSLAYAEGDLDGTRQRYERARVNFHEIGDRWGELLILNNLAYVAYEQRRFGEAQTLAEQALELCRKVKHGYIEAHIFHTLANLQRDLGQFRLASASYERALEVFASSGHRYGEALTLADWALLLHSLGDNQAALDLAERALDLARAQHAGTLEALALLHLGHAQLALGRFEPAEAAYRQSARLRRELRELRQLPEALAGLAAVCLAQGALAQALDHVKLILANLDDLNVPDTNGLMRARLTCFQVLRAAGDRRSRAVLAEAYARLQEQAATISDAQLRQGFLEAVAVHRDIVTQYRA